MEPKARSTARRPTAVPPIERVDELLLSEGRRLGIPVDPGVRFDLARQLHLLYLWNRRYSLTAILDPAEGVRRHVLESVEGLPLLPDRGLLVDLGSGTGYPSLPIIRLRPAISALLVESREAKSAFLTAVIRDTRLAARASVRHARFESAADLPAETTVVTLRGFPDPARWIPELAAAPMHPIVLGWLSVADAEAIAGTLDTGSYETSIVPLRAHPGGAILRVRRRA